MQMYHVPPLLLRHSISCGYTPTNGSRVYNRTIESSCGINYRGNSLNTVARKRSQLLVSIDGHFYHESTVKTEVVHPARNNFSRLMRELCIRIGSNSSETVHASMQLRVRYKLYNVLARKCNIFLAIIQSYLEGTYKTVNL